MQAMVYARAASNLIQGPKDDWSAYDRHVANAVTDLEGFNAVTMDQTQYTAMVAKLKDSVENDKCRHAYHAGIYANSGGNISRSRGYDDDDDWETEEEEDYY